jgi:hypothetical protein
MLEHPTLLLHDWTHAALPGGERAWIRPVTDAAEHSLGFVRFAGNPKGSWLSWLRKARLDVYETEDAAHLLTLMRSWGVLRIWEVDDAENRHVGTVYTKTIVSSEGYRLGYLDRETGEQGRILDPTGSILLRYAKKTNSDLEVAFTPEAMANPFLRMLMLACVLALDPAPKGEKGRKGKGEIDARKGEREKGRRGD